jgi:O-antigen/teichoic acid export membrane protein
MVWQLIWLPYLWVSGLMLSLGRARSVAWMTFADAGVYVVLLLILVPIAGATGAAWATLLRFALWTTAAAAVAARTDRELGTRTP